MTDRGGEPRPEASGPLVLGEASLRLHAVPSVTLRDVGLGAVPWGGHALVGSDRAEPLASGSVRTVPDGNRAATLMGTDVAAWGRRWAMSVKGVGAGGPLYGDDPLDGLDHRPSIRPIVRESWMGESPYGAQGQDNALAAVARTDESVNGVLFGMPICPTVRIVAIPEAIVEPGHHYRAHRGAIVQEHRLVPSNLRLFHGTGRGLGQAAGHFVDVLGLDGPAAVHAFVETLLATGLGALTLFAASLREGASGLEGLDFDDAWLDKDTLIAPDGSVHFVDLESLDWITVPGAAQAHARMRRQLARNAYDLLFVADALLRVSELRAGERVPDALRRARLIELFASGARPWRSPRVALEATSHGLDLTLMPGMVPSLTLPLIDSRSSSPGEAA
jgi:hypothetical protein